MNNFLILNFTGLLHRFMYNRPIFGPKSMKFGKHVPYSMSMTVYHLICYFKYGNGNNGIFLSDDHIWKCQNSNSHIS